MTITSSTGTLSSPGIGSGLDVNTIVAQLVALEKQPLQGLQTKANALSARVSAYGSLQSQMSGLNDAAAALANADSWRAAVASSSNTAALTASVSGTPATGSYLVQVQQLATGQATVSPTLASSASSVGTGSLSIQLGSWNTSHTTFSASGVAKTVTIAAGAQSLSSIATQINAASAGVTATVVQDVNGSRLVLRANSTGASAGFRAQASDDDGNNADASGLSQLAFDPSVATASSSLLNDAANAKLTVNGLSIESASNTLTQAVDGLSMQLTQTTSTAVTVGVSADPTAMTATVQQFVSAYNALNSSLSADLKYDATNKISGPLQGDRTTVAMQSTLHALLGSSSSASSTYSRLSDMGVQLQSDGSLKINSSLLSSALSDTTEVSKFFTTVNLSNASASGFGVRFGSFASGLLSATGTMATQTASFTSGLKRNATDQQTVNDHAAAVEKRLRAQYTALDANVAKLNALNSYVTQQFTLMTNQAGLR